MMGYGDAQPQIWHTVQLESLVPSDHPLRRIRPLIDTEKIRELCAPLYCADNGRPSIPPEQLFLAMLGGYLLGCRSDRMIIRQLTCDMAFRWFVGLDIDSPVWDPTTFSKNRLYRFDKSDILERLFDETVERAIKKGWVSMHWSVDGTLVRANASLKSIVPIEVLEKPEAYRRRMSKGEKDGGDDENDKGNPSVGWHGQKRSNKTHRSSTDPDSRLACKSNHEAAQLSYAVNGVMENRNRILTGIDVKICGGKAERDGAEELLDRARSRYGLRPQSLGADKGYFVKSFIAGLFKRHIEPHVATYPRGRGSPLARVRMRMRGLGYRASQRARKKIEELWGEGKENHGLRRFARRGVDRVRQEAMLIGWLLNLKRLATLQAMQGA
ncbi:MAG: transposase [bacterium]